MRDVIDLIDGYQSTCVLIAAHRIELFDRLRDGGRGVTELANEIGADLSGLRRLARALCNFGLLQRMGDSVALTENGRHLLKDGALADVLTLVDTEYLSAWGRLDFSVLAGNPAFDQVFGMSAWQHRESNSRIGAAFNRMVEAPQRAVAETIAVTHDFSSVERVVDVGGGNGYLLSGLLRRFPRLKGTLFDLPHVVANAKRLLVESGVAGRCDTVAGSFFEQVPRGAELYVLQYVLHDWDEPAAISILRRCREAMHPTGRLLILEKLVPEDASVSTRLVMRDLHMMAVLGGRERTLHEYAALLDAAGLRQSSYTRLPESIPDILEVTVARRPRDGKNATKMPGDGDASEREQASY